MVPVSPLNESQTRRQFAKADVEHALRLLGEGIGGSRDAPALVERIRSAAIRVSDGKLDALEQAIALAALDWRDLLVAAEFANDANAHLRWLV